MFGDSVKKVLRDMAFVPDIFFIAETQRHREQPFFRQVFSLKKRLLGVFAALREVKNV